MPDLRFAPPKKDAPDSKKLGARTKSEPQRRNGIVLSFDLRLGTKPNELNFEPVLRPVRKMTPALREQLQAKIIETNDVIRERRALEELMAEMNIKYNRCLQEIMDLGPFEDKELQDLSHVAFKALRLYR